MQDVWEGGGQGCAEKGKVKMSVQWVEMFLSARRGKVQDVGSEGCGACGLESNRCPKKVCFFCGPGPQKKGFYLHFYGVFLLAREKHILL